VSTAAQHVGHFAIECDAPGVGGYVCTIMTVSPNSFQINII
jgi:hypothetical protein